MYVILRFIKPAVFDLSGKTEAEIRDSIWRQGKEKKYLTTSASTEIDRGCQLFSGVWNQLYFKNTACASNTHLFPEQINIVCSLVKR